MSRIRIRDLEDLEKLGDQVQDIIESAVKEGDFRKLNQTITQVMDHGAEPPYSWRKGTQEEEFRRSAGGADSPQQDFRRGGNRDPMRASERVGVSPSEGGKSQSGKLSAASAKLRGELYGGVTGVKVKGILKTVFGGILAGGMGVAFLTTALLQLVTGVPVMGTSLLLLAGTGAGAWMFSSGYGDLGRTSRFQKYIQALGERTYCNFELLSQKVNKPVKFVRKDIKNMISLGWFRQGHVDRQETCLITANETYRQYEQTQKQLEERQQALKREEEARNRISPEVREILEKGDEYLEKIRRSNDAIPGAEISAKISRMEQIVENIFDRAEAHPEVIRDLKRFMDYYLPMTVKLLDAYEDMDKQPVQGENIRNSKKEIEDTLDTLNDAFARILDSIFQDTAWDVSSDISVLHTVLAQEGLAGEDFKV